MDRPTLTSDTATVELYESIASEFSMTSQQLAHLIELWEVYILGGKYGQTIDLLRELILEMRSRDSSFTLSLNTKNLGRLVSTLKKYNLVQPKPYPKNRQTRSIDGRRYVHAENVHNILTSHIDTFRREVRKYKNVQIGYRSFVDRYNLEIHEEYLPLSWECLSYEIRLRIRELIGVESETAKISDIPEIRFATKEELFENPYFREFIEYSLATLRLNGEKNFLSALRKSLVLWNQYFSGSGTLKVPISIRGGTPEKMSFQKLIGSPDRSIRSILSALDIDQRVWSGDLRKYTPSPKIHRIIASNPFMYAYVLKKPKA